MIFRVTPSCSSYSVFDCFDWDSETLETLQLCNPENFLKGLS